MNKKNNTTIPKTPQGFLWYASQGHLPWAFSALFFSTLAVIAGTTTPYLYGKIVDAATVAFNASSSFDTAIFWTTVYVVTLMVMYLSWRTSGLIGLQWATRVQQSGYNALFKYLSLHSHSYFSNRFAGALTNKVSHAADGTERMAEQLLWNWYTTLLGFVVSGFFFFLADVRIGMVYIALLLVIVVVNIFVVRHIRPYVVKTASENSILRGQAVDVTSNMSAVRQFARRDYELSNIAEQVETVRLADVKQAKLTEYSLILNNTIVLVAVAVMFFVMLDLLQEGAVTIGAFIMVATLSFNIQKDLVFIGRMMNGFIRIFGEVQEGLSEVLTSHEIIDAKDAKELEHVNGVIDFKSVTFGYGDETVFSNFNLHIKDGEKIGIVGHSGAGKTTLVSMLLRQHEIAEGSIEVDGQNIAHVTQDSLRNNISVVPQDSLLFHRTIEENIRYGNLDATEEEIKEATKHAQAHAFIEAAPQGYQTHVGERGIKLSGGQRQRIAIARSMVKNAPILVLDEATSSLDSESEVLIQKALHTLMEGKTVIAIAHRLSTLKEMDRIIVLEGGNITQDGTHEELLKSDGLYSKLWNHQADGFIE